jgi:cell division septal protein FtsQ
MDRSMAAAGRSGRLDGSARGSNGQSAWLPGFLGRARGALSGLLAALGTRRRLRIALLCALVALPLLGGAWMWLRHSSFVAVEHVRIAGAHGQQASAIESALTEAARRQSTLDVSTAQLKSAVARFPEVATVHVVTSFPHSMRIVVVERAPVAALLVGGARIAIGADGVALGTGVQTGSLPTVADDVAPPSGERARNPLVLQALTVLGAAPRAVRKYISRAYFSPRGLTVAMRTGLLVYFGDATRPHAKWLALAAVLAEPTAASALYVDVRTPERAAAGFAPGSAPHEGEGGATGEAQMGKGESTVSALAAGLAAATPVGREHSAATAGEASSQKSSEEAASGGGAGSEKSSEEPAPGAAPAASGGAEAEATSAEPSG